MYKNILLITIFSIMGVFVRTLDVVEWSVLGVLFILLLAYTYDVPLFKLFTLMCIGLSIAWVSLGVFYHTSACIGYERDHLYHSLVSEYNSDNSTAILTIYKVDGKRILPKKIRFRTEVSNLKIGESIKLKASISKIGLPSNPGEANYRYIFYGKNIVGQIDEAELLERTEGPAGQVNRRIAAFKETIILRLSKHLTPDKVGLSLAMSLGDKSYLSEEDTLALRKLGLSHILVVSSLHVGLLVVVLRKQLDKMRFDYHFKEVLIIAFLLLLLIFIDSKISIMKCLFIYMAHLIAQLNNRKPFYLLSLFLYTLLAIMINPFYLFNLSFTLSLMAYIGVFVYYRYTWRFCPKYLKVWYLTLCIYLGILPVMLATFGGIHYLGLFVSPFFMPYLEMLIAFNFLSVLIQSVGLVFPIQWLLNLLLEPLKMLVLMANKLSEHFLLFPFANTYLLGLLGIALLIVFVKRDTKKHKLSGRIVSLAITIVLVCTIIIHYLPMRVFYLDVGMGDSQYIYHAGKSVLIDGGTPYEKGHILDVMKITGEKKIDLAIISHEHNDHYGGIVELLEDGLIKEIYMTANAYKKLEGKYPSIGTYKAKNHLIIVDRTMEIDLYSNWRFKLYSPTVESNDPNDNSIVCLFQRREMDFLFTGDAEAKEEAWIIGQVLPDMLGEIEYLKVAHHGSKTSSTESFLLAARPNYGMISVGENNRYGLPDEEILERYDAIGTKLHRTDQKGAFEIKVFYPWVIHKEY